VSLTPDARALLFAGLIALVLAANWRWGFDKNIPPHYTPRLRNKATYPKAFVHFITALAIIMVAVRLGVDDLYAAIILSLSLPLWEATQGGTIDGFDIGAGFLGVLVSIAILAS